jgi:hypothetical protein
MNPMADDLHGDSNVSEANNPADTHTEQVLIEAGVEPSYEPGNATDAFALWQEKAVHADKPASEAPSEGETADKDRGSALEDRKTS